MIAVLLVLLAQPLPAPGPVDDGPTAFACTLGKVIRGERCTFEGAARPAQAASQREQAAQNSAAAAEAASGCAAVPEGPVRKSCERAVAEASLAPACTLGGAEALADAGGRLVLAARGCVASLRAALEAAQTMARVSHGCCRCLARGRCAVGELQCNRELSELTAGPQLSACVARACSEECAFFTGEPAASGPASRPASPRAVPARPVPDKI